MHLGRTQCRAHAAQLTRELEGRVAEREVAGAAQLDDVARYAGLQGADRRPGAVALAAHRGEAAAARRLGGVARWSITPAIGLAEENEHRLPNAQRLDVAEWGAIHV